MTKESLNGKNNESHSNPSNYIDLNNKQTWPINFIVLMILIPLIFIPTGCNFLLGDPGVTPVVPNDKIPLVSTNSVISITATTAISGGNVKDEGSATVTARGIIWYPNSNLAETINNPDLWNHTVDGYGTGVYTSSITGLISNTTYYVRAYATNRYGTRYGLEKSFKSESLPKISGEGLTDIENNFYPTVIIDSTEWMARNLMVTKLNDGTSIQEVKDSIAWRNLLTPAYCWLLNDESKYKEKYGALYNFYVVKTEKLCPVGWHVPTLYDWSQLIEYLGGPIYAPIKLKEKDTDVPIGISVGWDGENEVGFTALASGMRDHLGIFNAGVLNDARNSEFWTSTVVDSNSGWAILFSSYDPILSANQSGLSVRCVKNH